MTPEADANWWYHIKVSIRAITLRFPEELYRLVRASKRKSMNSFVLEAVAEKLERDREAEIVSGLQSLVKDFDQDEFEDWSKLQKDAMRRALD